MKTFPELLKEATPGEQDADKVVTREALADAVKVIRRFARQNDAGLSIVGAYGTLLVRLDEIKKCIAVFEATERHLQSLCDNVIDPETAAHAAASEVCRRARAAIDAARHPGEQKEE